MMNVKPHSNISLKHAHQPHRRSYMYIAIEDEQVYTGGPWDQGKVIGLHQSIGAASVQVWRVILNDALKKYMEDFWCKKQKSGGIGPDYHIIEWDMSTNRRICAWHMKHSDILRQVGEKGRAHYQSTVKSWCDHLEETNRVPAVLWNSYMKYEDLQK